MNLRSFAPLEGNSVKYYCRSSGFEIVIGVFTRES
jgi:hypothetical protein